MDAMKNSLTPRLQGQLAKRLTTADFDHHAETAKILSPLGLSLEDTGGKLTFFGQDPIVPSPLRFGAASAVALAAKAVAVASIWRMRTGEAQDIHVDVRKALRRFAPFWDGDWEKLNGHAGGSPWMVTNPFQTMPMMFKTGDDRWVMPINPYPRLRTNALKLLRCTDSPEAMRNALLQWKAIDLETAGAEAGVVMAMVRTPEEFMQEKQYDVLAESPLIKVEKISESEPKPFIKNAKTPLDGIRALGLAHVVAGAGFGRALALHGADVLNVWHPLDVEHEIFYNTSNVGMRSTFLDPRADHDRKTFDSLLAGADIFFANRRVGYLQRYGLSAEELCNRYPGLIHTTFSLHGDTGPWSHRPGFDETAGAVSGVNTLEGTPSEPRLTPVAVVNDYVVGWLGNVGAMAALRRRAVEGGSYRVSVSLTRGCLWLLSMGIFDKTFAQATAGSSEEHTYVAPDLFTADTPMGRYQGVTEQVQMSRTPGSYSTVLIPRGSSQPRWLPQ